MVLESIINPLQAEKKPWEMIFIGILYSSIAVLLGMMIFGDQASLVVVFLTVLACAPIMYGAIKLEENKDITINSEKKLLKEHGKALSFFMFLFLGITVSLSLWYVFLPSEHTESVFSVQMQTISEINSKVTGGIVGQGIFAQIFFNNFKVMIFCLLFAFLYGLGAIFILVWNASVLATAIGNFTKTGISAIVSTTGQASFANYFNTISLGLMRYSLHGIPEIFAYFVAGLAGGIISIAIIRHDFQSEKFYRVLFDSTSLIVIAVVVLFVAAFIEVFITPVVF